jgi:hypothetical protein
VYLSEDKHSYSVPYRSRAKTVELFYTVKTVEIYENNVRIASHLRSSRANGYTTRNDHMPPEHKYMADWNPERLLSWAENIGEPAKEIIGIALSSKKHPEQSYKTCLGILNLSNKYPAARFLKACRRALYYGSHTCKGVENILKNNMEDIDDEADLFSNLPDHENIRGSKYYTGWIQ